MIKSLFVIGLLVLPSGDHAHANQPKAVSWHPVTPVGTGAVDTASEAMTESDLVNSAAFVTKRTSPEGACSWIG